eukprot:ANDGO_05621.mRNA.1 Metal tolerance protein 3
MAMMLSSSSSSSSLSSATVSSTALETHPSVSPVVRSIPHSRTVSFTSSTSEGMIASNLASSSSSSSAAASSASSAFPKNETHVLIDASSVRRRVANEPAASSGGGGGGGADAHVDADLGDFSLYLKSEEELKSTQKNLRQFYALQNEYIATIRQWRASKKFRGSTGSPTSEHVPIHDLSSSEETGEEAGNPSSNDQKITENAKLRRTAQRALVISFWANVLLLIIRVAAVIFTPSLLMITAVVDGSLDLLSGAVLFVTSKIMSSKHQDVHNYPVGVSRMEPLGILMFACVMFTASIQIVQEGVIRLVTESTPAPTDLISLFLILSNIVVKIFLYLYCRRVANRTESGSVDATADDHRNDIFTSSAICVGIVTTQYVWWLDAVGAILLALYIMFNWVMVSLENLKTLSGSSADPDTLRFLTYVAANHDSRIMQVDTVRAYRQGPRYWVECDIVLPPDMHLVEAHDIGESLQHALESVKDVERAFVHLDYETDHNPMNEHQRPLL